jgi:hypothetical protein
MLHTTLAALEPGVMQAPAQLRTLLSCTPVLPPTHLPQANTASAADKVHLTIILMTAATSFFIKR